MQGARILPYCDGSGRSFCIEPNRCEFPPALLQASATEFLRTLGLGNRCKPCVGGAGPGNCLAPAYLDGQVLGGGTMADGRGSFRFLPVVAQSVLVLASEVNVQSAEIGSHQSMRSVGSAGRSRMRFLRLFASFLLSIGAGHLSCAAAESPKTIELAENWKLTSANKLQQSGAGGLL